jgi:hypothetical protein
MYIDPPISSPKPPAIPASAAVLPMIDPGGW